MITPPSIANAATDLSTAIADTFAGASALLPAQSYGPAPAGFLSGGDATADPQGALKNFQAVLTSKGGDAGAQVALDYLAAFLSDAMSR